MPTSLVTGGAGFIGSHVALHLVLSGHRVIIIDNLSGGFGVNLPSQSQFIEGSVTDEKLVASIFKRHPIDYVFHLAAYAAEGLSHFIRRFNYSTNLCGSINLINEAVNHDIRCFVFVSSAAVYGDVKLPYIEDTYPLPKDPYAIAKYATELDLQAANNVFGLDYVILRPHNVYGPGQHLGDLYRNVVGIFMKQALNGDPLTIFGDGSQTRAFTFIDDIAHLIAAAPLIQKARNQVINIGSDKSYTVLELADQIRSLINPLSKIEFLEPRTEIPEVYSDHSKAKTMFRYVETPLETGLKKMFDWAKNLDFRQPSRFENIEIQKKLPSKWRNE